MKPALWFAVPRWRVGIAAGTLFLLAAPSSNAQVDLPTLSELGVEYVSPGGLVQLRPSLRVDVDVYVPDEEPAWHLGETKTFLAGRGSLFLDLFVGRRIFVSTELRADRGQPARAGSIVGHLQQAFVRLTPTPGKNVTIEAGKFISPFGNYPRRAHTEQDPFIRPPLPYDYRTVISADNVPGAADAVFTWKDRPSFRATGLPIVWEVPYPVGVTTSAGGRTWGVVVGITNTAPSADPSDWNNLNLESPAGPSVVAHANYQLIPELQLGASYSRGPYMRHEVFDPSGPIAIRRQMQDTVGFEGTFSRGYLETHAELLLNRWNVFRVNDSPGDLSYYGEARMRIATGFFVAARYGAIQFRPLQRSSGVEDRWDYDTRRIQLATGYRLGRGTEIRAEYMINRTLGREDPHDNLLSLQWWWTF